MVPVRDDSARRFGRALGPRDDSHPGVPAGSRRLIHVRAIGPRTRLFLIDRSGSLRGEVSGVAHRQTTNCFAWARGGSQ